MSTRMQQRRDTSTQWSLIDPVLAEGEIGFETDTGEFRLGDGTSTWSELSPFKNIEDLGGNLDDYIPLTQKAQDLGVATLDGDGSVPLTQLVTALSTAQGYADTAETDAKAYADSLATNYDAAGAASTAQTNAQTFATNAINALDTDDIEEGTTNKYFTDSRAQSATSTNIATAKSEAITAAGIYADGVAAAAEAAAIASSNSYTDSAITDLVNAAPGTLDTLNELAAAIGDDPSFAVTVASLVSDAQTDAQDFATNADSALYIQVTTDIASAVTTAEGYADSLATNYDAFGSASNAESSANAYTDAHAGDSTNIHGIADTAALATKTYVDNAVDTYNLDTTNVHGIADTTLLETLSGAQAKADAAQSAAETHADLAAATAQQNAEDYADGLASNYEPNNAVATHNLDTTSVHGIADTAALATKTYADAAAGDAQTAAETYADGVASSAQSAAELYADGVASAAQTAAQAYSDALTTSDIAEGTALYFTDERAQDAVGNNVGDGLSYTDSTGVIAIKPALSGGIAFNVSGEVFVDGYYITTNDGTQVLINKTIDTANNDITVVVADVSDITATASELNTLDGIIATTSELNILSGVTATASELNTLDGITASTIELNYVDGVTSSIQDQIDSKSPTNSPTFTGTVSGITKAMVDLANVDNTSDANKPVSTATQTALDLKADLAAPNLTGTTTVEDLEISGALTFTGTATQIDTTNLAVTDSLIYLAAEQYNSDIVDIGIYGAYGDSGPGHLHTGLIRDASDGKWKLISGGDEPTTNVVDFTGVTYDTLKVGNIESAGATLTGNLAMGSSTITMNNNSYIGANSGGLWISSNEVVLPTNTRIGNTSATEIGYLDGVTSAIQTQLDNISNKFIVENNTSTLLIDPGVGTPDPIVLPKFMLYASNITNNELNPQPITLDVGDTYYLTNTEAQGVSGLNIDNIELVIDSSGLSVPVNSSDDATVLNWLQTAASSPPNFGLVFATAPTIFIGSTAEITATEISYLDGVTSSIQSQIDGVLPSQSGNSGKYLTTDGTDASWATLNASPALDDLSDVAITSVATNDVVYYDGTSWVNKNVSAIPTLINDQYGTTYTLTLADAGKVVEVSNASEIAVSVPTDASVDFPIGTQITILQTGAGQITVAATTPETTTVNYTPGNKLRAQWSSATLIKRAADTWVLIGDLA